MSRRHEQYARRRLDNEDAVLEWTTGGYRYWAWSYDGKKYVVKARVVRGEIKSVREPRRLGHPQLNTVLREQWIKVRSPDDEEVPDPVTLLANEGPSVVSED